jgi:hypothetical protein
MYCSPYGSSCTDATAHLSRLDILERESGADAKHPTRRLFVGLTMILAPFVMVATVIGLSVFVR